MTVARSAARVFSGTLSHLMVNDVMAAGLLTHTYRDTVRDTPIRIAADVLSKLDTLSEGPIALYGEMQDGTLTVLGPDLRRSTLAAARPRGDMGPPAPRSIEGVLSGVTYNTAKATGALYVKGTFSYATEDGTVDTTFLVRGALAAEIGSDLTDGVATLRGVLLGSTFEVIGLVPATAAKGLSREQKDAKNARARARRAEKKAVAA